MARPSLLPAMLPLDQHNTRLLSQVHPADWQNPTPAPCYNLVIIGAGTAGLVGAAAVAGLGGKVALIEKHLLGGDCLNAGCVPSKAIIRSSRFYADLQNSPALGANNPAAGDVDFPGVMERMRKIRARLSQHDSAHRFRELGVDVFLGEGQFAGRDRVEVKGQTCRFKKALLATGARAACPSIEGLADAGYLTNETIFNLTARPRRLLVMGAGPIGCELAQAFRRLGSEVIIVHRGARLLPKEHPEAAEVLGAAFKREGIEVHLDTRVTRVEKRAEGKTVHLETARNSLVRTVDEILVGLGRSPNVEGLNLEKAGVRYSPKEGVEVNDFLQTTNRDIYAAGDICLAAKFTHMADATARLAIQNALFWGRKRLSALTVPRCTYTDPEIAQVGMSAEEARQKGIPVATLTVWMREVDRAILDGEEDGFLEVLVRKGTDRILGATLVARHAGEMINEISLAMAANIGLKVIGQVIHPYPTQAEAIKKAADAYNRSRLTPRLKQISTAWLAWKRKGSS